MSNFLRSSPAQESGKHNAQLPNPHHQAHTAQNHENIDPALYSQSPTLKDQKKHSQSSTKLAGQMTPSNFTGWTPLISKTINNEQLLNFNSTPSSKFVNNVLANSNQQAGTILPQSDVDYFNGLNLTPFLNQNINLLNSNSNTNNNLNSFTPFHDRSLHLTDFFMDSPIRATPLKDLDTITPSKFRMGSDKKVVKPSIFQDPKSAKKRSIHDLEAYTDTPGRSGPHKLSITTKANDLTDEEEEEEDDDSDKESIKMSKKSQKSKANNETLMKDKSQKATITDLQTPSKVIITDSSKSSFSIAGANSKTPTKGRSAEFMTPAKPTECSSPSTVILSSTSKSPSKEQIPNSPTPNPTSNTNKSQGNGKKAKPTGKFSIYSNSEPEEPVHNILTPAMGTFSEASKPQKGNKRSNSNSKKHEIKPLGNANTNTMKYHRTIERNETFKPDSMENQIPANIYNNDDRVRFKAANKAQMQAGMNKFQIVLSGGGRAKRGRKGKKASTVVEKKKPKKEVTVQTQAHGDTLKVPHYQLRLVKAESDQSHDTNLSSNKDSSIMSGNNNSMNTSNLNVSSATDHTSFEFGALSSTPNGKFFLDKIFEKPSPQSQQLLNQVLMAQQYPGAMTKPGDMPPPKVQAIANPLQSNYLQQHPQNGQTNHQIMMMMSTPNHQNIYSPNDANGQSQSQNDGNDDSEVGNISLSAFNYNNFTDPSRHGISMDNR